MEKKEYPAGWLCRANGKSVRDLACGVRCHCNTRERADARTARRPDSDSECRSDHRLSQVLIPSLLSLLPEVERAVKLLRRTTQGRRIINVDANEDNIVYAGITHEQFAYEVSGRIVKTVQRYGKVFYIELEGEGKHPVMHFGMTGMLQVKGELPMHYREAPRKSKSLLEWPPRFMKFVLHVKGDSEEEVSQVAFLDARRLGRIRLCQSPLAEPPISTLGFDPIISMPGLDDFKKGMLKRSCPIKALLLDQSFSAGVGNWVADEILYHARVHPEERCNVLTNDQLEALHTQTSQVCQTAVSVNADDSKFPEDWLFKHRWGKGKDKRNECTLKLADGKPATIKWITVGGRTSAFVVELQKLKRGVAGLSHGTDEEADDSDLTSLSTSDEEIKVEVEEVTQKSKRKRKLKSPESPPTRITRRKTSGKKTKTA